MRCPLIVRLPGCQTVLNSTDAMVESVDIYPTLCEFAGLRIPTFLDGESFFPVLAGTSNGKPAAFSQIRPVNKKERNVMAYSVRTQNFRYVEWREPDNRNAIIWEELYDYRNVLGETNSVVKNPEYIDVLKRHKELVSKNYPSLSASKN